MDSTVSQEETAVAKSKKDTKAKKDKAPVVKKDKPITLNFYQLTIDDLADKTENAKIISKSFKTPLENYGSLIREEDDGRISLFSNRLTTNENGLIYGTLVHTQFKDLPFMGSNENDTYSELPIEDDKGLGYDVSFLFDPEVNVVMIESARNGVGIGAFCEFFRKAFSIAHLDSAIVINPGELARFKSFKWFTKIHYKVARLQNGSPMLGEKNAIGDMTRTAATTGSNEMEAILSAGRFKNASLVSEVAMGVIEGILRYTSKDNKDVKKLLVTGKSSVNEFTDEIDLIKQRVKSEIKVELRGKNNLNGITERYRALYSAYIEHKGALHKAYKF
jgi:hypothetical protein